MVLPALPVENEDPWFPKRDAFDQAVKKAIETDLPASVVQAKTDATAAAKTYSDDQATTTLNSAKSYADDQTADTLTSAKTYADTKTSAALNSANSYADTKDAAALKSKTLTGLEDLNGLTTPGKYLKSSGGGATTANNWPVSGFSGYIEVTVSESFASSYVLQTATGLVSGSQNLSNSGMWVRSMYGAGVWKPWMQIQTDQTRISVAEPVGTDLNSIQTPGNYFFSANSLNAPVTSAGHLEVVVVNANYAMQRWTNYSSARPQVWTRILINAVWQPWVLISSNEIVGSGSPQGVVNAVFPGVRYTDQAMTNGARSWISTVGGTQYWKVTDGDTGWRDVSNLLDSSNWVMPASLAACMIRRRSPDVVDISVRVQVASGLAGTPRSTLLLIIPNGFRPSRFYNMLLPSNQGSYWVTNGSTSTQLRAIGTGNWAVNEYLYFSGSYITSDADWPAILPGVPTVG